MPAPPPEPDDFDDVLADARALGAAANIIHGPDGDPEIQAMAQAAADRIAAKYKPS